MIIQYAITQEQTSQRLRLGIGEYGRIAMSEEYIRDLQMKAKSVDKMLEDIKAEIAEFEEEVFHRPNTDYEAYACVRHCLDIIDKHMRGGKNDRL